MPFTKHTYDKLILADGQPQYGRFADSISEVNHSDFDYQTIMDKPANPWQKYFNFNQFHFLSVQSSRYIMACAIANVRYTANAFVYLFDRESLTLQSFRFMQPLGFRCQLSNRPFHGRSHFEKGSSYFEIIAEDSPKRYNLTIRIKKQVAIDLEFTRPQHFQPLAVCTRTGYNGWAYTEKSTCQDVSGIISWDNRDIPIEGHCFLGNSDWSCGYMRRETAWNWANCSGFGTSNKDQNRHRIGINLAAGVNETTFSENGFWVDGNLHLVGPANFQFNRKDRMQPWNISTEDDNVGLTFVPEGNFNEKINILFLASNFSQLPGRFYGALTTNENETFNLDGISGVVEDHFAKW